MNLHKIKKNYAYALFWITDLKYRQGQVHQKDLTSKIEKGWSVYKCKYSDLKFWCNILYADHYGLD